MNISKQIKKLSIIIKVILEVDDVKSAWIVFRHFLLHTLSNFSSKILKANSGSKSWTINIDGLKLSFAPFSLELMAAREILVDQVYNAHKDFQPQADWLILDLGANIGVYSLKQAKRITMGRIFAVEPNPLVYQRLFKNIQINHFTQITPLQVAIGPKNGKILLEVQPGRTPGGRITERLESTKFEYYPITAITLDELITLYQIKSIDLVKMDIEGAELEVIKSIGAGLEKIKRLVLEYHSSDIETISKLLVNHGFEKVLQFDKYAYFQKQITRENPHADRY